MWTMLLVLVEQLVGEVIAEIEPKRQASGHGIAKKLRVRNQTV